jgi:DNA polymerase-3 subunit alpha
MFVHLRSHTEFSIVDGTCRVDDLVGAAAADAQPALAVTDLCNLFGAIKFYQAARAQGVKPILGVEVLVQGLGKDAAAPSRLLLLAQNHQGYLNLCELLARAWTSNVLRGQALVKAEWLEPLNGGLIALAGAQAGPVGQALLQGDLARAGDLASRLARCFPQRFYLELQRAGRVDDQAHVAATVQLAARLRLPVVATHPVQFTREDDYQAHEARVCIADGEMLGNPKRERRFTREQYFKSAAQMSALFSDIPSALANSVEIARRCSLSLRLGNAMLPNYPTPEVDGRPMPMERYFGQASQQGLDRRLAQLYPDAAQRERERPRYQERLAYEIGTILEMGFPGYFLIVGDFIAWARNNGCPVGPGRGSGAGSLVAYSLGITDLDPLKYKLLFERFLNPERVSMPDFDIDFCQNNRDRVIEYVKQKYGKDAVSQIVTFGTLAARAAIRDVGRVLDMSYTFCDGLSKLIPNKPGQHVTIADAIRAEPLLAERLAREDEVRTLIELAQKLEGLTRNVGMHAGGVVIAPSKLTDFCPLYQQPGSDAAVSQFDKNDVEAAGLVKFDFLGLATLTILEMAKGMVRRRHAGRENFDYGQLPLDDAATYKLFGEARTEAVFQFESSGMQRLLREAKPTRLEDLIAMNALYRPGPMDLIPSYVARKLGREPVEYPDPRVEAILSETYGIMVYQEQVMQMAQILAGYSLGKADVLRRAMGKKDAQEMDKQRAVFREGAGRNGIAPGKADEIFDLMEKFAGYGFNKSHSAAYALLAYHTAWLKVHYRAEFFCANMTVEMGDTDKLRLLFEDARRMGLSFEPPDVNRAAYAFEPVSDEVLRYGLGAVKGTGQQAIEAVVAARAAGGPFSSLFDFCARVDRGRLNKRAVEALVKGGALDSLHSNRAELLASVDRAFDYANALAANVNQGGLFDSMAGEGGAGAHGASDEEPSLAQATPWDDRQRLGHEKAALGLHLTGHLFDQCALEVRQFARRRLDDLSDSREPQLLAGIVTDLRVVNGQRGKLGLFRLDDRTGSVEVAVDEALLNANRHLLKEDELVIISGKLQPDRFSGGSRLNVQQVWDLDGARCRFGKYLRVSVNGVAPDVAQLVKTFPPRRELSEQGELVRGLAVRLAMSVPTREGEGAARAELQLGEAARFYPCDAALAGWAAQAANGQAVIVYE